MRNLTIKRIKGFVGCLGVMKIYIEDPVGGELLINETRCRKIGTLKNGEEKTFPIENNEAKVFVIADTMSKNFCNEYYQLPEGEEDIYLTGKNIFNPANGNAFRFDNNQSAGIMENRKKGTKKGLVILVIALIVGVAVGKFASSALLSGFGASKETFSCRDMSITLTEDFKEVNISGYTTAYESKDVAVFVLREGFNLMAGAENYTLKQYADLVIQTNKLKSVPVKTNDGLTYFTYEYKNPQTGDTYQYFSYVYKSDNAFWLVQFAALEDNADKYEKNITKWAKTVTFED